MTNPSGDAQSRAPSTEAPDLRGPLTVATSTGATTTPPAPADAKVARERLAAALHAACSSRESDDQERATAELRTSVTGYVAALRNGGVTVEHAVISTKELLVETIGGPNIPAERRALAERVVSWGIDAYYDSPPRAE